MHEISLDTLLQGPYFEFTKPRYTDGGVFFTRDLQRIVKKENVYGLHSHSSRIAYIAEQVADADGLPKDKKLNLVRAACLHDVGKTFLPDILFTKVDLTDAEKEMVRTHVALGYKRVFPYFPTEAKILGAHHLFQEDPYPKGWKIDSHEPVLARMQEILALSDNVDALLTDRSYKKAWTVDSTRGHLTEMFNDPGMVNYAIDIRMSVLQ